MLWPLSLDDCRQKDDQLIFLLAKHSANCARIESTWYARYLRNMNVEISRLLERIGFTTQASGRVYETRFVTRPWRVTSSVHWLSAV